MPNIVASEENEPHLPFFLSVFPSDLPAVSILHRRSSSYYRLPSHLLKLTVLKLDGTSFDVQVSRTASVRELKAAVEKVFGQSPDRIKESISWTHVWGQFCLSYRGLKLIDEKALLKNFGIKDSDQIIFYEEFVKKMDYLTNPLRNLTTRLIRRAKRFLKDNSSTMARACICRQRDPCLLSAIGLLNKNTQWIRVALGKEICKIFKEPMPRN